MPTRQTPTHSPAPFSLDSDGDVLTAEGEIAALVYTDNEADRRLILKAPELLAACRTFCREVERITGGGPSPSNPFYLMMKPLVDHIDGDGE